MYLEGERIWIEDVADREAAYLAAIAADPLKPTALPMLRKVEPPFDLGPSSKDVIARGLANIELEKLGIRHTLAPEKAGEHLDDLYGQVDSPEDFATPLEQPTPL
jgi:hypothetical protein